VEIICAADSTLLRLTFLLRCSGQRGRSSRDEYSVPV